MDYIRVRPEGMCIILYISVYFSTFGVPFTRVCGQAIGYQHYSADAFAAFRTMGMTIDDPYVDGLSITYDLAATCGRMLQASLSLIMQVHITALALLQLEGDSRHPLWGTIITANLGTQVELKTSGTMMTPSGMVTVVLLTTPAVTLQTYHGSTEWSTHHLLLTSNCTCVKMKMKMKMWQQSCLNCTCIELVELLNSFRLLQHQAPSSESSFTDSRPVCVVKRVASDFSQVALPISHLLICNLYCYQQ